MRQVGMLLSVGGMLALAGCSSTQVMIAHSVELVPPAEVIPEEQLLDVAVVVFDPGVPEGEIPLDVQEELIRDGTFVQIRRMESMYMAVELQETLRKSGHWGGVWVTPGESNAADVNVTAEIRHSDGDIVKVRARAVDAPGRVWLSDTYELETPTGVFNRQRYPNVDPYQDLFRRIANDLAGAQARLSPNDRTRIRTVASLRYAEELSPDAFAGYVAPSRSGIYDINRLPADGDPMFDRTQRIRQRERLFIETLNAHYAGFARDASSSYHSWREYAREEALAIREVTRSARVRTGLGIATILASVIYGSNSGNSISDRVVRDAMMYIGMDVLQTAALRRQERRLHADQLEELSMSFSDEVQPMVVEVQGTEHRLTGTAEMQYQEWRDLLRRLFISETGFVPEDMQFHIEDDLLLEPNVELAPVVVPGAPEAEPDETAREAGSEPSGSGGGSNAVDVETAETDGAPAEAVGSQDAVPAEQATEIASDGSAGAASGA